MTNNEPFLKLPSGSFSAERLDLEDSIGRVQPPSPVYARPIAIPEVGL